jgi:hypothetical protein
MTQTHLQISVVGDVFIKNFDVNIIIVKWRLDYTNGLCNRWYNRLHAQTFTLFRLDVA